MEEDVSWLSVIQALTPIASIAAAAFVAWLGFRSTRHQREHETKLLMEARIGERRAVVYVDVLQFVRAQNRRIENPDAPDLVPRADLANQWEMPARILAFGSYKVFTLLLEWGKRRTAAEGEPSDSVERNALIAAETDLVNQVRRELQEPGEGG